MGYTSCKKVPEQKCHYEPTYDVKEVPYYKPAQKPNRECQVDVAYKVQAYKDSYKKECHYIEVPKCKTVKKPVYSEEKKKECKTTYHKKCEDHYEEKCHTEYRKEAVEKKEQVCHTEYRKECKPSYGYGETCENIPEEKCQYKTIPHTSYKKEQVCHKEKKQKCVNKPIKVPYYKHKHTCVWPSKRSAHDDTRC